MALRELHSLGPKPLKAPTETPLLVEERRETAVSDRVGSEKLKTPKKRKLKGHEDVFLKSEKDLLGEPVPSR